jgi:hypothetical protein
MKESPSHWYCPVTAEPRYEIAKKDGSGMRPTTLADARKNGWVPSATTVLRCLAKPQLQDWLIRTAVTAVVTAPDVPGEGLDAKITRVLDTERQQDQESQMAMGRGTAIHAAIENKFAGKDVDPDIWHWVAPAYSEIAKRGRVLGVETIVIGDGYGGRVDLIQESDEVWILDWKSAKTLPKKGAWTDHVLQAAAYAAAYARRGTTGTKRIRTGNVYISTTSCGDFTVCEHDDWMPVFEDCWKPLLKVWCFLNNYVPA